MGTSYHTIRPLKRGTLPRRFIVLACAAQSDRAGSGVPLHVHRLRVGALTYLRRDGERSWSRHDHTFESGGELVRLLDRYTVRKETTWLVAHDLGYHLTVSGLWQQAMKGEVRVEGYNFTGRYCSARFRLGGKVLHCVDSSNYLEQDWQRVGDWLGLPGAEHGGDACVDSRGLEECRGECATVAELVMRLCAMLAADARGSWGWSLGSLAWQSWRRDLPRERVHVHAHAGATELERAAYTGARTECGFIGTVNGPVYEVDFNSLYAHCLTGAMPARLVSCGRDGAPGDLLDALLCGYLAVADVSLDSRLHDYPADLWLHRSPPPDGPAIFPGYVRPRPRGVRVWGRGRFRTTLATPELRQALEAGEVTAVHRVAWYEAGRPFDRFVDYWYARRLKYRAAGRRAEEAVCKRLLTMLPGKFGQKAHDWTPAPGVPCALPFGHWWRPGAEPDTWQLYRALGGCAQVYGEPGEWQHSFPGISAHVTSAARLMVQHAVEICGPRNCYYYDCDALHVSRVGLERLQSAGLIHDTELGRLKLKGIYRGACYRNARDYCLEPGPPRTAGEPDHRDADDPELPALHPGSHVDNCFRPGPDGWRSGFSVRAAARNRYCGRVGPDGWVIPLWLPGYVVKPDSERSLFDETVPAS